MQVPTSKISWKPSFRIIASKFPPLGIFERVAEPGEWDDLLLLEAMTDPSVGLMIAHLQRMPEVERYKGNLAGRIMAPFVILDQTTGGRFNNSSLGAYYACKSLETAIHETVFHAEKFLVNGKVAETQNLDQLVISADIAGEFHDVRGMQLQLKDVYASHDYLSSQSFAVELKIENQSNGIAYSSLRHKKGECIAVFTPSLIKNAVEIQQLSYHWNGVRITGYFSISKFIDLDA